MIPPWKVATDELAVDVVICHSVLAVQRAVDRSSGTVEPVEVIHRVPVVGESRGEADARNEVCRLVCEFETGLATGIAGILHHGFVPVVREDGSVAVVEQGIVDSVLYAEVVAVSDHGIGNGVESMLYLVLCADGKGQEQQGCDGY